MFLQNAWYVAAWGHEIGLGLYPVRVHGQGIVLFRKADGAAVALEDACPHRKLPLSRGCLKDGAVECGYHGLVFDHSGRCLRIPGQGLIPPSARVRAYPVAERWGLIWVWMGEPERADAAKIIHIEHYGNANWGMNRGEAMDFECHYLLVTDNLLDPSHVAWVHPDSFGERACEDAPLQSNAMDEGMTVSRWMMNVEVAPFYAPFVRFKGRADRQQCYEVRYPALGVIKAILTPAGTGGDHLPLHPDAFVMESYNFLTPVDENHTRYYWFQLRNFAADSEEVSQRLSHAVREAFEQDRAILNAVHIGMKEKRTPYIDLLIDRGPLRFRRRLARLIEAERSARPSQVGKAV